MSEMNKVHATTTKRFSSLADLQEVHDMLLEQFDQLASQPENTVAFWHQVTAFVQQTQATGAVLDVAQERRVAQSMLDFWSSALHRANRSTATVRLAPFDPELAPELPDEPCPYQGLAAFSEDRHEFFFGRERLLQEMLKRLRTGKRLLAVIGASGSGKSSVVLGGFLPMLRSGALPDSQHWRGIILTPGTHPLDGLARAVQEIAGKENLPERSELVRRLEQEPHYVADLLALYNDRLVVLVVDQFEELFTLCDHEQARDVFVTHLLALVNTRHPAHRVVLTMRTDFVDNVVRQLQLWPHFRAARIGVDALDINELRAAIEQPAAKVGLRFEEGIVDNLISTILGERAGLPLLQFTLLKLWQARRRNRITREIYEQVGNPRQALERSAESFYISLLPEDQKTLQQLLLRMARPDEGREFTSSRIRLTDIFLNVGASDRVARVLRRLIFAERLVKLTGAGAEPIQRILASETDLADQLAQFPDAQIEVAHEALVRNWPRLLRWLEDEWENFRRRQRLTEAVEQWLLLNRDDRALLRGIQLEEALRYTDLNALQAEYIAASKEQVEQEQTRWRNLAEEAERQARIAMARQLAAQSKITSFSNRSLLLALEALQVTLDRQEMPVPAAVESLYEALANSLGRGLGKYHRDSITVVIMTSDNRWLITGSNDKTVRVWDLTAPIPGKASIVLRGHEGRVEQLAISADGRWLVSGSVDRTVCVWSMRGEEGVLSLHKQMRFNFSIRVVAISPDSRWLVVGTEDKDIYCWDLHDLSSLPTVLRGHEWGIRAIDFSNDGIWMASGSDDKTIRLWDMGQGRIESVLLGDLGDAIWAIAFTPDDCWLVAGSVNGTLRLWERSHPAYKSQILNSSNASITALAVTQDSHWIVVGRSDSTIQLWNLARLQEGPTVLEAHEDWISVVVISSDSRWLVTGSGDKTVRLWNLQDLSKPSIVVRSHERCVRSVAISSDNRWLASSSDDGTVQLLNLDNPAQTLSPRVFPGSRAPIAISSDNHWLASSSETYMILLWDLTDPSNRLYPLKSSKKFVRVIAISPDGQWLAAGTEEPQIFLWRLTDPVLAVYELSGHAWGIQELAFSADSRWLASGSDDHRIFVWDVTRRDTEPTILNGDDAIVRVTLSPDQRWLISGDCRGAILVWNFADLSAKRRVLAQHASRIWILQVSPNNRWLVTGGYMEKFVHLWDLEDMAAAPVTLRGHAEWVTAATFSPNAHWLVTVSEDGLAHLWKMTDLSAGPRVLPSHEWGIRAVDISSDCHWLATGSDDRTIRLWQFDDLSVEPIVLRGHDSPVTELKFSQDSHRLVTASAYGATRAWNLNLHELMELACFAAGRNLTLNERKQYFPRQEYDKTCLNFPVSYEVIEHESERAHRMVEEGDIDQATQLYQRVVQWATETDAADLNNRLGLQGCIAGLVTTVMPACERVVTLEPDNGDYRLTRGIARALVGDIIGAMEDFEHFLDWGKERRTESDLGRITTWLKDLQEGRNPLDPLTLRALFRDNEQRHPGVLW